MVEESGLEIARAVARRAERAIDGVIDGRQFPDVVGIFNKDTVSYSKVLLQTLLKGFAIATEVRIIMPFILRL